MTAIDVRGVTPVLEQHPLTDEPRDPTGRRVLHWLATRRRSLAYLLPLLALSALVFAFNLAGSPQRIDDEGTYTAQAYAVEKFGELSHYTYWYDHPPLGWLQIAGWTSLTDGFARYGTAVIAAREAMLVAHLAAVVMLWLLARRLRLSRPAAAAAVLIFSLSPLALQYHRTVYLDNVATPWMLAAFVLALAPRRQLLAFIGSAACLGVAVLSKETYLLALPFVAWTMWRGAHRETRRYTLSVAGTVLALIGVSYVLLALVKGEVTPGANRVSLVDGLLFQLADRSASGSVFDAASLARRTLELWLRLDPVLAVVAPIAAVAALFVRPLRPVAAALVFLLLFMLRPGYLPVPYVIAMLPFAALVVPGVVDAIARRGRPASARVLAVSLVAAAVTAVAVTAWIEPLRGLLTPDADRPLRQATSWLEQNAPKTDRLLVDDAAWVDLVEAGFDRADVVWYYKADTDPAVSRLAPRGYVDYDYILSTDSVRTFPDVSRTVTQAFDNSVVVATFGTGPARVDVRRIVAGSAAAPARAVTVQERAARVDAGAELTRNPRLTLGGEVRASLLDGRLDARALTLLSGAAAVTPVRVDDLPAFAGEDAAGTPRHAVRLSVVGGSTEQAALRQWIAAQQAPFAPTSVTTDGDALILRWQGASPTGLLPTPPQ